MRFPGKVTARQDGDIVLGEQVSGEGLVVAIPCRRHARPQVEARVGQGVGTEEREGLVFAGGAQGVSDRLYLLTVGRRLRHEGLQAVLGQARVRHEGRPA